MLNQNTAETRAVELMQRRVTHEEWDDAATHFTPAVTFRAGNLRPVTGFADIRAYLTWRASKVRWDGDHERTKISEPGLVVTEVESRFRRLSDDAEIVVPGVHVYRFERDEIAEWQIYGDFSVFDQ